MQKEEIIQQARAFVQEHHKDDYSGHDWRHIERVTNSAKTIADQEGGDLFVIELAALMHDVADEKISESEETGVRKIRNWLDENEVEEEITEHIIEIVTSLSFKGGNGKPMKTKEGKIVQDANRLDALGAVGIARTFAYSGAKGQPIHDPDLPTRDHMTYEQYRYGNSTAVNHFYEKLLKLKEYMNTAYGKQIAQERHQWNGDK